LTSVAIIFLCYVCALFFAVAAMIFVGHILFQIKNGIDPAEGLNPLKKNHDTPYNAMSLDEKEKAFIKSLDKIA